MITSFLGVGVLALGVGACGSSTGPNAKNFSGEQQNVAQVVDDLQSAAKDGDGNKICNDIFDPSLKSSVAKANSGDCAGAVTAPLKNTTFTVKTVAVQNNFARAQVAQSTGGPATMTFVKRSGDWKMLGATPNIKKAVVVPKKHPPKQQPPKK